MPNLTSKQERFVQEYLIDLNATQAAIRAGYSEKGARTEGARLLANANIADAVAIAQGELMSRTQITQDQVLKELAKIGFSDIRRIVAWGEAPTEASADGSAAYPVKLVNSESVDDETAAAISEVSLTAQGIRVKMYDKKAALDSMARHLGMFTDRVAIGGDKDLDPIQTEEVGGGAAKLGAFLQSIAERKA